MSFYTTVKLYRPGPPPLITGGDLSRFITAIYDCHVLTEEGLKTVSIKFGDPIDSDDEGIIWEEETVPFVYVVHEIEWDIDLSTLESVHEIIKELDSDTRPVYRASIMLGTPTDDLLAPITRHGSPENRIGFIPDTLSVGVGPVFMSNLEYDESPQVGWIDVGLSGYGYLYPWTFREVVDRLEASPEARRIAHVCRSFWPVEPALPDRKTRALRRRLRNLWPYDDVAQPWDWYWGLTETS
jgi:hypothetical protein